MKRKTQRSSEPRSAFKAPETRTASKKKGSEPYTKRAGRERVARATKARLQQLCGEYRQRKGELLMMRVEILKVAGELGLEKHIDIQMEW